MIFKVSLYNGATLKNNFVAFEELVVTIVGNFHNPAQESRHPWSLISFVIGS